MPAVVPRLHYFHFYSLSFIYFYTRHFLAIKVLCSILSTNTGRRAALARRRGHDCLIFADCRFLTHACRLQDIFAFYAYRRHAARAAFAFLLQTRRASCRSFHSPQIRALPYCLDAITRPTLRHFKAAVLSSSRKATMPTQSVAR